VASSPKLQPLGGQRLVIDQDGTDRHSGSSILVSAPCLDGMSMITLNPHVVLLVWKRVRAIGLRQTVLDVRQADSGDSGRRARLRPGRCRRLDRTAGPAVGLTRCRPVSLGVTAYLMAFHQGCSSMRQRAPMVEGSIRKCGRRHPRTASSRFEVELQRSTS
jgi:hypothetical protein